MTATTSVQQQLPPGPQTPAFFQILQWTADPLQLMETSQATYGDPFTLEFRKNNPFIYISHPDTIQEILSQDSKYFDSGKGNDILLPIVGEQSILLTDGKTHTQQRKLIFPPFHGEKIRHYGEIIAKITEKVAQNWKVGQTFSIRPSMQEITLEVIMQTVFGISEGDRHQQLKTRLMKSLELAAGSVLRSSLLFLPALQQDFPGSPWRNFLQRQQSINDLLQAEIEQRRQDNQEGGNDVLSLLMSVRDEDGNPMSDEELRNQLITLLFAGHETTATALAWAFYWIHKFPEVREKLLTELQNISDSSDIKALNQLPYLDAVCNETLRIYPVAIITFPRITKSAIKIGNYEYPPETILAPCIYLLHHREEIYPNSKQFRPERFLEREFSNYEFMPFGGGTRRCIGDAFAPMEMKIVIATVLKQYQLTLAEKKAVKPVRRGVTVAPAGGIKMMLDH
ncbi:MAG: cytochrome P450 [Halothece sp.]